MLGATETSKAKIKHVADWLEQCTPYSVKPQNVGNFCSYIHTEAQTTSTENVEPYHEVMRGVHGTPRLNPMLCRHLMHTSSF